MRFRTFVAAAIGAVVLTQPVAARDLVVAGRGGRLQAAQDAAYVKPFVESGGGPVAFTTWQGGVAALAGHSADWDVVLLDGPDLLDGCGSGALQKLDWQALGGRDRFLPAAASDCGVGSAVSSLVLTWDRDKFSATPNWSDFWDVARYPGKRGLRRGARSNLEIALMADGVSPGDVYRLLRTDDGVERAFHKLDQLKPYVVWWAPETGASQILRSGEVLLTSADNAVVAVANQGGKHLSVQWNDSLYAVLSWAVAKDSPNAASALKFLAFASDPARQALVMTAASYGPTVKGANEMLPPEVMAMSPTAPANQANTLAMDEQFWRENGDKLDQRFEAWLAHS